MAKQLNLDGLEYISDIPGVYYDAGAEIIDKTGNKTVGTYFARIEIKGTGTIK